MRSKSLNELILWLPAAAAFALLILRGDAAAAAAQKGLQSCLHSVIPSLFPFLVLTNLMLRLEFPKLLSGGLGKAFEAMFSIRRSALPVLLAGMVGGYPLGAEAAAEACRLDLCSEEEAERLMIFANNCSPGFLFSLVSRVLPGGEKQAAVLLLLQWLVSFSLGILLGRNRKPSRADSASKNEDRPTFSQLFTSAVRSGGRSILLISAYVVFFSVFSVFMPDSALLRGILELTGGILLLSGGSLSAIAAAFLLGWGGLSVACQVFSALEGSGIPTRRYLPLRLLHGLLMALGMFLLQFGAAYLLLFAVILTGTVFFAKYCGNQKVHGI